MRWPGRAEDTSRGRSGGKGVLAAGSAALLIGAPWAAARWYRRTAELGDRLDDLGRRLDRMEEWAAGSEEHLSVRLTALDERQTRTDAFVTDLQRVILAVSAQVAAVDRKASGDALARRLEVLERGVTKLRDETERTGAMAATAVAASDEATTLVASLRDLRHELVQLSREMPPADARGDRAAPLVPADREHPLR